jgi:antitoxin PrlF
MSEALKFEEVSTLTDRYQTTVPETVRRVLNLHKRDRIYYSIRPNGEVLISGISPAPMDDPVLGQFLEFLQKDIANHPEHLQAVDATLFERINSLVGECGDIDLNAVLSEEDDDDH